MTLQSFIPLVHQGHYASQLFFSKCAPRNPGLPEIPPGAPCIHHKWPPSVPAWFAHLSLPLPLFMVHLPHSPHVPICACASIQGHPRLFLGVERAPKSERNANLQHFRVSERAPSKPYMVMPGIKHGACKSCALPHGWHDCLPCGLSA